MEIATWGNVYLQEAAPWALAKEDPNDPRIAQTMNVALQVTALLAQLCEPFLPFIAPKLRALVGQQPAERGDLQTSLDKLRAGDALLPAGQAIGTSTVLFPKIIDRKDDSRKQIIDRQKMMLEEILAAERGPERPAFKENIEFDDFQKLDLRTATVTTAEPVPKADKLLKLTLDLGNEERTVVSGIALQYKPEEVVGKQVVLVANLAPRKLRGVLSQGMVLMAEDEEGKLVFVSPAAGFGNGWIVR